MKFITRTAIIYCLALVATAMSAQTSLPTTTVGGKEYYYYDVQPKETLFSVARTLGVTRESIIENNPAVADGLQAYTRLYFPIEQGEVAATQAAEGNALTHTVKKGETLYGISRQYNVSVDRLIALNPEARDGVRSGQVLKISAPSAEPAPQRGSLSPVVASQLTVPHVIASGETLYRIAADNGITVEDLLAFNPEVDPFNYSVGTELKIPVVASLVPGEERLNAQVIVTDPEPEAPAQPEGAPTVETPRESVPTVEATPEELTPAEPIQTVPMYRAEETPQTVKSETDTPLEVAILLPFMLGENTPSRSAELFTDFYRGFLLAAEELAHDGRKIRIRTFDTCNSNDTVARLMSDPSLSSANLIVTPDNDAQFSTILGAANPDTAFILNLFLPRNSAYADHANVIQANIPHTMMYDKAAGAMTDALNGRRPVFVSRINGPADKAEFVETFQSKLNGRQIPYRELKYRDVLDVTDFAGFSPDSNYVFIPVSSSRAEFLKILPSLKQYAAERGAGAVTLYGYPDWLTFRGDLLESMHALDATVYSRFYNDEAYSKTQQLAARFKEVYGRDMRPSVPSQAVFGYDAGRFIINSLRGNGGDFHASHPSFDGLQTDFILSNDDTEGLVNTSLLLIEFTPGGVVKQTKAAQ